MLKVQVNKRTTLYVSFCEDTQPNKGGYYCQVYADPELECQVDDFVVHNYQLRGLNENEKKKRACVIANSVVKGRYA